MLIATKWIEVADFEIEACVDLTLRIDNRRNVLLKKGEKHTAKEGEQVEVFLSGYSDDVREAGAKALKDAHEGRQPVDKAAARKAVMAFLNQESSLLMTLFF